VSAEQGGSSFFAGKESRLMFQTSGTDPAPGSLRELLRIAIPLVLSSGSVSLVHTIDRVFLTWDSTDALAAAMPAGLLHWAVMSVLLGTSTYVNTFVAQYDGGRA
jgi:multidrug resistance protein, MATE family